MSVKKPAPCPGVAEVVHFDPGQVRRVVFAADNSQPGSKRHAIMPPDCIENNRRDPSVGSSKALNRFADPFRQVCGATGDLVFAGSRIEPGQIRVRPAVSAEFHAFACKPAYSFPIHQWPRGLIGTIPGFRKAKPLGRHENQA